MEKIDDCEAAINHIINCDECKKVIILNRDEALELPQKAIHEVTLKKANEFRLPKIKLK